MPKLDPKQIIHTAIISAFTFVTALIWRDVILDFIKVFVPPSNQLLYKFLTALIATIIIFLIIYLFVKTEHKAYSFRKKK